MSAILQLKKDIQLLNSQLEEVKKLNEYIKINSTEIDNIKKDFNIINKELKTIIHSNNLLHSKEIKELKEEITELKPLSSNMFCFRRQLEDNKLLYNKEIKELKEKIKELEIFNTKTKISFNKFINEKLEDNKAIYNKEIKELKEEIIKLKSISPKDNNKIEKDISEIKRFIKILMGEKFKCGLTHDWLVFDFNAGDSNVNDRQIHINKSNCLLIYYLNKDIMDDYLNNFWDYFKQYPNMMRNRHDLNFLRSICDKYFRTNPINWEYIKNYYKLEI